MMAWFSGCLARTIQTPDGILDWPRIATNIRRGGPHGAPTTLICLENTHNMSGGTVYRQETIDEICTGAHALGIKVHIDGARVFNASVATGTPVARIAEHADSLMFCLSKGLGAPVGSMVVGTADDIAQARLYRKRLGGGMRQAGVLAAAGLIALDEGADRLADDHRNARYLAERIARIPGISIRIDEVQTNIVIFDASPTGLSAPEVSQRLKSEGVLANGIDGKRLRMVTHRDVNRSDCERAADVLTAILAPQTAAIAVV
jgi:threonine aldolase